MTRPSKHPRRLGLAVALCGLWMLACSARHRGGDFTLDGASGPVSLHDFRGKVVLVYFGYMSCPDVCPTSLSKWGKALASLQPDELARVQPIFISVDPERDTPANLQPYATFFHPSILGLTGPRSTLARIALTYGASYSKVETGSSLGYSVDHSAETYVIGPDGELAGTLLHDAPPEVIADALRTALHQPRP